jgi:hypothetical protein
VPRRSAPRHRFKRAAEFAKLVTMNARKAVIPMLKRALISALIILPILAFIDWASSPLVQSCLAEGTVGTELQQIYDSLIEHRCPYESGVVIEGLRFAASWSPQVWTAIAGMAIALFAVVLGCFTVSLANSTRIAADAATHMAEAAVAAERARLHFIEGENNFMDYMRFAGQVLPNSKVGRRKDFHLQNSVSKTMERRPL